MDPLGKAGAYLFGEEAGRWLQKGRAIVLSASLAQETGGIYVFKGSYQPYWSRRNKIIQSREITYQQRRWVVNDVVADSGVHEINNFIHFLPDALILAEDGAYFIELRGLPRLSLRIIWRFMPGGGYFPEFGIKRKNTVIRLSCHGKLPFHNTIV